MSRTPPSGRLAFGKRISSGLNVRRGYPQKIDFDTKKWVYKGFESMLCEDKSNIYFRWGLLVGSDQIDLLSPYLARLMRLGASIRLVGMCTIITNVIRV